MFAVSKTDTLKLARKGVVEAYTACTAKDHAKKVSHAVATLKQRWPTLMNKANHRRFVNRALVKYEELAATDSNPYGVRKRSGRPKLCDKVQGTVTLEQVCNELIQGVEVEGQVRPYACGKGLWQSPAAAAVMRANRWKPSQLWRALKQSGAKLEVVAEKIRRKLSEELKLHRLRVCEERLVNIRKRLERTIHLDECSFHFNSLIASSKKTRVVREKGSTLGDTPYMDPRYKHNDKTSFHVCTAVAGTGDCLLCVFTTGTVGVEPCQVSNRIQSCISSCARRTTCLKPIAFNVASKAASACAILTSRCCLPSTCTATRMLMSALCINTTSIDFLVFATCHSVKI